MKYSVFTVLFLFSFCITKAQDTLTMRSGDKVIAKVIEVGSSEIKYKKLDNLNGPVFTILKSDLYFIRYENGTKDDFSSISKVANSQDMFTLGYNDAVKYYKSYKVAGNSILLTSAIPFYGFIFGGTSAAIASASVPSDENLDYPDLNLMKNEDYARGYRTSAKNIKRKKILTNYLSGLAISGISLVAIAVALTHH